MTLAEDKLQTHNNIHIIIFENIVIQNIEIFATIEKNIILVKVLRGNSFEFFLTYNNF